MPTLSPRGCNLYQLDNLDLEERDKASFKQEFLVNHGADSKFPLREHGWVGILGSFPSEVWTQYRTYTAEGADEAVWQPPRTTTDDGYSMFAGGGRHGGAGTAARVESNGNQADAHWFEALHKAERAFFSQHREYQEGCHRSCGIDVLATRLQAVIVERVRERVQGFVDCIRTAREAPRTQLKQLMALVDGELVSETLTKVAQDMAKEWDSQVRSQVADRCSGAASSAPCCQLAGFFLTHLCLQIDGNIRAFHNRKARDVKKQRLTHKITEIEDKLAKDLDHFLQQQGAGKGSRSMKLEKHIASALEQTEWHPEQQVRCGGEGCRVRYAVAKHDCSPCLRPCAGVATLLHVRAESHERAVPQRRHQDRAHAARLCVDVCRGALGWHWALHHGITEVAVSAQGKHASHEVRRGEQVHDATHPERAGRVQAAVPEIRRHASGPGAVSGSPGHPRRLAAAHLTPWSCAGSTPTCTHPT